MSYANLAFYKFINISDVNALKSELLSICKQFNVFGSILLAPEGINGCISGEQGREWGSAIQNHPTLSSDGIPLLFKTSFSPTNPFKRMLVKEKKEIIALRVSGISPQKKTGEHLPPLQLKEWLDSGEDIILIDTRNAYEVAWGTFSGAITPPIDSFHEFPQWFDQWQKKTPLSPHTKVVTFCTGGIRCEKATAYMWEKGLSAYQIEGGILSYFEETKDSQESNYWNGELFVFDGRVALDKTLNPTHVPFCPSCYEPFINAPMTKGQVCNKCLNFRELRRLRGTEKYAHSQTQRKARSSRMKAQRQN